jgi:cyclohexanecarboxylate-CoA ligase
VLRPGVQLSLDEMVFYLRQQHMAVQYIPERLEVLDAMPSTATGKLQKFKLREIARQPQET